MDRLKEFSWFMDELWRYKDYDPAYPTLYQIADDYKLDQSQEVWLYFLFTITDCSASAFGIFSNFPEPVPEEEMDEYHSTHRKIFFGKERKRLIGSLSQAVGSFHEFFSGGIIEMMESWDNDYESFWKKLDPIYTIGTLTRFDFLELIGRRNLFNTIPNNVPTILSGCRGPINGVEDYLSLPEKDCLLYESSEGEFYPYPSTAPIKKHKEFLHDQALELGLRVEKDMALVETTLCKFQKVIDKRYYVGWEIDEELAEITHMKENSSVKAPWTEFYEARRKVFDDRFLKELQGYDTDFLLSFKKCKRDKHMIPEIIPDTEYNQRIQSYWMKKGES